MFKEKSCFLQCPHVWSQTWSKQEPSEPSTAALQLGLQHEHRNNQFCHCRLISAFKHYGKSSVAFLPPAPGLTSDHFPWQMAFDTQVRSYFLIQKQISFCCCFQTWFIEEGPVCSQYVHGNCSWNKNLARFLVFERVIALMTQSSINGKKKYKYLGSAFLRHLKV